MARWSSAAVAVAFVSALFIRPLANGVSLLTVAAFWGTVLGEVVIPGVLLCRGARLCRQDDPWMTLGQGATIGLAVQGLSLFVGRMLGLERLSIAVAVGVAILGLVLDRRKGDPVADRARSAAPLLALSVALAAVIVQPLHSSALLGRPVDFDLLFHAGNAGELRHRWPLQDPRVSGIPLRYHLLSYALPVEAATWAGSPVADCLLSLAPLFWLGLLTLQVSNAGRALFGDGPGAGLAAALALFHVDPGGFLGLGAQAFNSYFATAVYGSPTTVCGLIVLAGFAIALEAWISTGAPRHLAVVGFLAAAASAAKTSVLPVAAIALALCAVGSFLTGRKQQSRRWALAFSIVAVAGAPLTLWQRGGSESYAAIVHWTPGVAFTSSSFAARVADALGPSAVSGVVAVPVFLVWLIGYLGLTGLGACAWLLLHREPLRPVQAWALAVAVAGGIPALLLDVPGLSQLFLLYNGQLLLCLFAGAGFVRAFSSPRSRLSIAAAVVLALAALPVASSVARAVSEAVRNDLVSFEREPSAAQRDYAAGLSWLRVNASGDAVVFADNPSLYLSAFGEVRLFYENGAFTARGHHLSPGADPFPERSEVQRRLLRVRDAAAISAARAAVGPGRRMLVVADYVESRVEAGMVVASPGPAASLHLFPEELFTLRFANGAMQVYEAREPVVAATGPKD